MVLFQVCFLLLLPLSYHIQVQPYDCTCTGLIDASLLLEKQ
jgi:hypothetical protein